MRFTEIDVFGVYVAPMSLMMVAAWSQSPCAGSRAVSACCGTSGIRPFVFAVYMIVLSSITLVVAR